MQEFIEGKQVAVGAVDKFELSLERDESAGTPCVQHLSELV